MEHLDQIADMDDLMKAFERVMLERRIDTERFCQTNIVQYPRLSVGRISTLAGCSTFAISPDAELIPNDH